MLYFIASSGKIKIGWSSQPIGRLASFQTGNPEDCELLLAIDIENAKEVERILHERLSYCRTRGEWFDISFEQAFAHLAEIRQFVQFKGQKELLLVSPPRPQLLDHEAEFRSWFLENHAPEQWNEQLHPLWYLWDIYSSNFMEDKEKRS